MCLDLQHHFLKICVWRVFGLLVHRESKTWTPRKSASEDITTSSSICIIDVSWIDNVQEVFLSQILIYAIMYCSPPWPSLGPMTFGGPAPDAYIKGDPYKRTVVE